MPRNLQSLKVPLDSETLDIFVVLDHVTSFGISAEGLIFTVLAKQVIEEPITDPEFVTEFLRHFGQGEYADKYGMRWHEPF